jgi:hypothetical protein
VDRDPTGFFPRFWAQHRLQVHNPPKMVTGELVMIHPLRAPPGPVMLSAAKHLRLFFVVTGKQSSQWRYTRAIL